MLYLCLLYIYLCVYSEDLYFRKVKEYYKFFYFFVVLVRFMLKGFKIINFFIFIDILVIDKIIIVDLFILIYLNFFFIMKLRILIK